VFARLKLWSRRLLAHQAGFPPPHSSVVIRKDVAIPMDDGVTLYATQYVPATAGDYPTVLIRSPWGRGWKNAPFSLLYGYVAQRFAERGYIVILQDVRSAHDSPAANLVPHENEQRDGQATIRWLVQQPWFSGRLGLWGASYLGYVQWAVLAAELPTIEVLALVPTTTATNWFPIFHPDGALALDTLLRLQFTSALVHFPRWRMLHALLTQEARLAHAFARLPLTEASPTLPPVPGFDFAAVMERTDLDDPLWQRIDLHDQIATNDAHIHLIAGWHDIFLREQLADYQTLRAAGKQPYLTIGPWHHTSQDLGAYSIRTALAWFDTHLKGDKEKLPTHPVTLFVQGANRWQNLQEWPPATISLSYFIEQQGQLVASQPSHDSSFDRYTYDPAQPTPTIGGPVLAPRAGQQNNGPIEARSDVLTYTSERLTNPLTIMGTPEVHLYVTSSAASTDFFVRLCDVTADNRSLNVTDGFIRLTWSAKEMGQCHKVTIRLWPTAYEFAPGNRLRIQIASGAHPRWNRNLGVASPTFTETSIYSAEQQIHHDHHSPSKLLLPVFRERT